MSRLAQLYLRVDVPFSRDRKLSYQRFFEQVVASVDLRRFEGQVDITLEVKEGSTVSKLTVIGLLVSIYTASVNTTANYSNIKREIPNIVSDGRKITAEIAESFKKLAHLGPKKVLRQERRRCVPGKVHSLLRRLEGLKASNGEIVIANESELMAIRREIQSVLEALDTSEDLEFLIGCIPPAIANRVAIQELLVEIRSSPYLDFAVRSDDSDEQIVTILRRGSRRRPKADKEKK